MSLRVLIVSSEVVPFAKTGGLADVAGSLPKALKDIGCDVSIIMPLYRQVTEGDFYIEPIEQKINIPIGSYNLNVPIFRSSTSGIPVYFLGRDEFFDRGSLYGTPEGDYFDNLERFTLFSRGVMEAIIALNMRFDIIHCNDWQTGLIPAYLKSIYKGKEPFIHTSSIFTIHNIAYQGIFPSSAVDITGLPHELFTLDGIEYWGKISLLKAGIVFADIITTVSKRYSKEIQTAEFGYGMEGVLKASKAKLFGVINGVDYDEWSPERDNHIDAKYSVDDLRGKRRCKKALLNEYAMNLPMKVPIIGIISRFAEQKGFDIISRVIEDIMAMKVGFVVLGTGDKNYQKLFRSLTKRYPGRFGVKVRYDNALAHQIEAGSDIFLMPSRYEPCGLNQMYSLKYGTVPIVRATGGLDDTIEEYDPGTGEGNGFKFNKYSSKALRNKVKVAVDLYYKDKNSWNRIMRSGMKANFSWEKSAGKYVELYHTAIEKQKKRA